MQYTQFLSPFVRCPFSIIRKPRATLEQMHSNILWPIIIANQLNKPSLNTVWSTNIGRRSLPRNRDKNIQGRQAYYFQIIMNYHQ